MGEHREYPATRRDENVVDTLHGHEIADPYRWLEDPDSAETTAWVAAQNVLSESVLSALPAREWFAAKLDAVTHRARSGTPVKRSGKFFVARNDGTVNQDLWYVADTLEELERGGRVILDPNTFSDDGTSSVAWFSVSPDGTMLAYAVSDGGSDWVHFHLRDLATGDDLDDVPVTTKFCSPEWLPDGTSYLFNGWPGSERTDGTATDSVAGQEVRIHRIGSAESELVLSFPDDPGLMVHSHVSDDDRFLIAHISRGTERNNRLWLLPIETSGGRSHIGEPLRVFDADDAEYWPIRIDGDSLLLGTNRDAPAGRIATVDLAAVRAGDDATLVDVVPEGPDPIAHAFAAGDAFIVQRLVDAQDRLTRYSRSGEDLGDIDLPQGSILEMSGKSGDRDVFVGLSTVTDPTTAVHVDADSGATRVLSLTPEGGSGYEAPAVTVLRRRAVSADGTEVRYFLIAKDNHDFSTPAPTVLWGYGGFNIPLAPDYRPGWPVWLDAGGVLVIANLRGGGEYGTDWYEAGKRARKQNVFDDAIAVAEHLIETGVTTSGQLAMHGRSNGGLLAGALLTQRPDLFAAVIPGVGVLDLLRFHLFTIGAAWMSDYGDPDVAEDFAVALAYSPLHNVTAGTSYPPTLVLTGDHDDRVVPLHSHKFTATLQHAQAGDAPILTRIETAAGHGAGKPAAMVAAEWTDWLSFAAFHTGLTPPAP